MQPSRNFDDLKFSSIHRRILLWGSGGPFLDGYVLVMIGVALEQLTPALKLVGRGNARRAVRWHIAVWLYFR